MRLLLALAYFLRSPEVSCTVGRLAERSFLTCRDAVKSVVEEGFLLV